MKSIAEMQIENCYGCGGCEKVCPKSAISMRDINGEGFLYPVLDNNKCIECGLCTKKCPALVRYKGEQTFYPHSFAIKSNSDIAEKSSSAGVFSVFAEYMHSKGGWVCGAVYDEAFNVYHVLTKELDVIQQMKKSKYVQSNLKNVYGEIREKLENSENVFFSGTPCQVAGLMNFLGKEYSNLLTMDIVCHGVPSPGLWRKYLDENYDITTIKNIDFRHKGFEGLYGSQFLKIVYNDGKEVISDNTEDFYYTHFQAKLGLRKSCGNCQYAVSPRVGDVSTGDFWGAPKVRPDLLDGKKISILLLNTFKGRKIFEELKERFELCSEISFADALNSNRNGVKSYMHPKRESFFKDVNAMTFNDAVKKNLFPERYDIIIFGPTFNNNYGAIMTYFALYKLLENQGYKVALACRPNDEKRTTDTSAFLLKHVKTVAKTKAYYKHYSWMSDMILLGSDQVWNYKLFGGGKNNNEFFLDFCDENTKKVSYASSYGMNYLTTYNGKQSAYPLHNKLMKRFDYVSVREKDGVDISEREFDVQAEYVLDPVFLLDSSIYSKLANEAINKPKTPYLVSYFLTASDQFNALLQYTSEYLNLDMVNMGTGEKHLIEEQSKKTIGGCCADLIVEEWINNIKNSEFVVTDSYHCMCFSIIFRKNFVIIQKHWGLSRIVSLLELLGLEERRIGSFDEIKQKQYLLKQKIDYDKVYDKLNKKIAESLGWLNNAILSPKKVVVCRKSANVNNSLKSTKHIIEYFEKLSEHIDDYVIISCVHGADGVNAPAMLIKQFGQSIMHKSNHYGFIENVGANLLSDNAQTVCAKGNGGENSRTLGIKISAYGLKQLKEKEHSVFTISFDWETTANQGQFKIQMASTPWDDLTGYITIAPDKKSGHYENIYMTSDQFKKFESDELQVRVDNMNGEVIIKDLKIEVGNRATRPWIKQSSIHGFGMIFDNENDYMNVSTTSMANIAYSLDDVKFLVEYQNEGYRNCSPNSEIYIEVAGSRYIYPCEAKGTYFFVYSKEMKEIVDISFVKYDDYNMQLEHR